jgi:HEAT repeat protein
MSSLELVILVLIAIGSAIVLVLLTVATSSLVQARRAHLEPLLGDARKALVAAMASGDPGAFEGFTHLDRFSTRCMLKVMLDLAPSVTGRSRVVLVAVAEDLGVVERARAGLGSRRWSRRLYSARVLTALGVESDELHNLLIDRSPEVRAQAAAWSVLTPSPPIIELVVALLDDHDGLCRYAAQDALIRIGLPAAEALLRALEGADEVVTGRILRAAAAMGDDRFFEPALRLSADPSWSTRAAAAAVIARTGNQSAGPSLIGLLNDESDRVVLTAVSGLGKLAYWPAAAAVEALLDHPTWEIRRQAGLTLLALGPVGAVLLQVNVPGNGPGAEMAAQALELGALALNFEVAA